MLECMGVVNGVVVPLLDQSAYVRDCLGYVGAMVKWICLLLLFPLFFSIIVVSIFSLFLTNTLELTSILHLLPKRFNYLLFSF